MVGAAKVMAVVKANAYGHGAVPIAHVLSDIGVSGFCVALAKEAEEFIAADINNDGSLDITDIVLLVNIILSS